MAEITTNTRQPRVDMTPMVDLGFLLITFFVFTTTFSSPTIMKLTMPDKSTEPAPFIKYGNTLTLILGKDNRIFWHQKGNADLRSTVLNETSYGTTLSKLIIQKRNSAIEKANFTVIIKPSNESNYKNTVDVLDEMAITNQVRYLIADISIKEKDIYHTKLRE